MPQYHQLIVNPNQDGQARFDRRQELLKAIEQLTGRPVVVYAANLNVPNIPNSIDISDVTPISDLTRTVPGRKIDIMLHSPGGLAEAAERIVALLRGRFDEVRFAVLHSAYSAATMLATSADELILDDTSALGPIDPQIVYRDPQTGQSISIPTQTILDGFDEAKKAIKADSDAMGVYLPLLNKLDLHLFEICKNAEKLSRSLVEQWLRDYMFKGSNDAAEKAKSATQFLASHKDRLSHSRPITIDCAKNTLGFKVLDLREHAELAALYRELWAEVEWFVENTDTAKFFENAHGLAFRRRFQLQQQLMFQLPLIPQQPPQQPQVPQPEPPPAQVPEQQQGEPQQAQPELEPAAPH